MPPVRSKTPARPPPPRRERRRRVFVVDDHALVREWLAALVRQQSDLEFAGDAETAPAALAAIAADPPDLAIVDLSLKSGSGLDLIKDLREHSPATAVLVLSMHDDIFYVERAFRAGARGYVSKRDPTPNLLEAVRSVLAGRLYARPDLLAALAARIYGRDPGAAGTIDQLSDRETEVFRRLGEGQGTRKVATEMGLSMKTVQAYHARIKTKLGLANAAELVREAVRWNQSGPRP